MPSLLRQQQKHRKYTYIFEYNFSKRKSFSGEIRSACRSKNNNKQQQTSNFNKGQSFYPISFALPAGLTSVAGFLPFSEGVSPSACLFSPSPCIPGEQCSSGAQDKMRDEAVGITLC